MDDLKKLYITIIIGAIVILFVIGMILYQNYEVKQVELKYETLHSFNDQYNKNSEIIDLNAKHIASNLRIIATLAVIFVTARIMEIYFDR